MRKKNNKNILMISSSSSLGGGTKHMFMLGRSLKNNFNVFYAIPKNKNFFSNLNNSNHLEISERNLNFKDIYSLRKFIKSHKIDILHAHGKGAGVIARILSVLMSKSLIYTFHGIHLKCHKWYIRIIYILYEFLFGRIDTKKILVSKSEKAYAKFSKIFLGDKWIIINNGVSNKQKKILLNNQDLESTKLNVISLCRFVTQKNIFDIIRIAKLLPNLNFSIIGDGPLREQIRQKIFDLKLDNVFLLGQKKNIFKFLYNSDIYLSTSLYEGLPISILEAMSIGLPIVASNVIGNLDTIENGESGFLYELEDIDSAVFALRKLANSKILREKLGNKAFQRQRKMFSKDLMIKKYISLYKKI